MNELPPRGHRASGENVVRRQKVQRQCGVWQLNRKNLFMLQRAKKADELLAAWPVPD
jgi:hypothetical protein